MKVGVGVMVGVGVTVNVAVVDGVEVAPVSRRNVTPSVLCSFETPTSTTSVLLVSKVISDDVSLPAMALRWKEMTSVLPLNAVVTPSSLPMA